MTALTDRHSFLFALSKLIAHFSFGGCFRRDNIKVDRIVGFTHQGMEDLIELLFSCLYFHSEGLSHMTIAPPPLTPEPSSLPSLLHPSILLSSPSCWPWIVPEGDTLCHPSRLRGSTFCQPGSRLSPEGGGGFRVPQEAGRGETHRLDASGGDWRRGVHEACVRACT